MQGKTPSAPVVPGALTADPKKSTPTAVAKQKPNNWGRERLHTSLKERERGREGRVETYYSDERGVRNKSFTDYGEECSFQ